jgi:hypothetical protein
MNQRVACATLDALQKLLHFPLISLFKLLKTLMTHRFSSVTERFFMELNNRRVDTPVARSETLNIINGMRYLKLGV